MHSCVWVRPESFVEDATGCPKKEAKKQEEVASIANPSCMIIINTAPSAYQAVKWKSTAAQTPSSSPQPPSCQDWHATSNM